ncbi:MAG: S9 family peptidase [Candidatus Thermoplasmatota archaeon]|nr:S9 family peptidase [Candidatus Thermoplasmatota archaeon]
MLKKSDIADLFSAIEIQEFEIHPSGKKAICSVNRGKNWELATLDLSAGRLSRLLSGEQSLMSPVYSPEGGRVAYHTDFEGDENHDIVVVNADGRGAKKHSDGVEDNYDPRFSPDGERIAFLSNRDHDIDNLYLVGSRGGSIRKLTDEEVPVRRFAWSPLGDSIVYETGVGDDDFISLASTQKAKTKKILYRRNVEHSLVGDFGTPHPWSSDGDRLLFASNENDAVDIGMLDIASGMKKWLVRSKKDKYAPQWSPDDGSLAYLEVEEPNVVLKVRRGENTALVSPREGTSRAAKWLPDGRGLVFVNGSSRRPEEVFVAVGARSRRLTRFRTKPLPKHLLVSPKTVRYCSFDGLKIPAMLFSPRNRSRRAGIVLPHGGPEMMDTNMWDQLTMMLLDRGFHVLKPNYRGSTGYGRRFLHLHDKDLGGGDYLDTVYAGKYLVDSGLVDKDRLGYWGASYSGFTCMLALTKHPDMWAAGVSIVGFFDWETEHETERGYLKKYDESKMGDPKKNPELFKDRSPINFLERLKAPLLMTASAKDVRCPPTESRAVVAKLKAMGKKHQYHEYPDEGHWPRKRKNLIDLYGKSTDFLDEHIPS